MIHNLSTGAYSRRHTGYFTLAGLMEKAFTNLVAGIVFLAAMDLAGTRFSMGTELGVESQKPARQQMSLGCYKRRTKSIGGGLLRRFYTTPNSSTL